MISKIGTHYYATLLTYSEWHSRYKDMPYWKKKENEEWNYHYDEFKGFTLNAIWNLNSSNTYAMSIWKNVRDDKRLDYMTRNKVRTKILLQI